MPEEYDSTSCSFAKQLIIQYDNLKLAWNKGRVFKLFQTTNPFVEFRCVTYPQRRV